MVAWRSRSKAYEEVPAGMSWRIGTGLIPRSSSHSFHWRISSGVISSIGLPGRTGMVFMLSRFDFAGMGIERLADPASGLCTLHGADE